MDAAGAPRCGWYGKLPALGDFGHRRLPADFVSRCDDWLARGMQASRAQLGEPWLQTYLHAPLWRFAWAPGVVGPDWWMGVMMPSVDAVGRYFPLLLAQACTHAPATPGEQAALQQWYAHLAQAALSTLQAGGSVERLEALLATAPDWLHDAGGSGSVTPTPARPERLIGRDRHMGPQSDGPSSALTHHLAQIAAASLLERVQGHSLWWWPEHPDGGSLSLGPGLPAAEHFSELLQGRW